MPVILHTGTGNLASSGGIKPPASALKPKCPNQMRLQKHVQNIDSGVRLPAQQSSAHLLPTGLHPSKDHDREAMLSTLFILCVLSCPSVSSVSKNHLVRLTQLHERRAFAAFVEGRQFKMRHPPRSCQKLVDGVFERAGSASVNQSHFFFVGQQRIIEIARNLI